MSGGGRQRAASVASAAVLAAEALGTVLMWAPLQVVWFWVGAHVYDATGSIFADGVVALAGFLVTIVVAFRVLTRLDAVWVDLRRRAGHDQVEGVLNRVVVASATFGVVAFWVWFHVIKQAFVIPFMPSDG